MKITSEKRVSTARRDRAHPAMFVVAFEASDSPVRSLIEPKLAKYGFELTEDYVGTSTNPFLAEALTLNPQIILRALTLDNFRFEGPVALSASLEAAAWGARFGFTKNSDWLAFHYVATISLSKLPELSQISYAAYLFSLIGQDRGTGYQIAGVISSLVKKGRSPILTRSQIELFMRVRTEFGPKIDVDLVANLLAGFTLVEALEIIAAKVTAEQLQEMVQIRYDYKYDASVSELISMLGTTLHRRLQSLMA